MGLIKWLQNDDTPSDKKKNKKIGKDVLDAVHDYAQARRDTVRRLFELEIAEVAERGALELWKLEEELDEE